MNMRPIVQQKSTGSAEADVNIASTSINSRNWTTYIPEADNARNKCVDLSPDLVSLTADKHTISSNKNSNTSDKSINYYCENTLNNNAGHNVRQEVLNAAEIICPNDCDTAIALATPSDTFADKEDTTIATTDATINLYDKPNVVNNENAPLLKIRPSNSITLVKRNSTSLIFTKKDVNPVVHRKRVTLVRSDGLSSTNALANDEKHAGYAKNDGRGDGNVDDDITSIISHTDETISSPQKRHSYHWHSELSRGQTINDKSSKRKKIKSWYAVIGSSLVRDTGFDSDSEDAHLNYESLTCSTPDVIRSRFQLNQNYPNGGRIQQRKLGEGDNAPSIHRSTSSMKDHSEFGPTEKNNDANMSKYTRFEQLLKNLVGRKVSRESVQIGSNGYINKIVPNAQIASTLPDPKIRTSISSSNLSGEESKSMKASDEINFIPAETHGNLPTYMKKFSIEARCMNTPLLSKSPKIRISRAPSAHSLHHNEKCFNTTTSSASTTSLNTTVQQHLWSVVPLLRRDGSCSSLNQSSSRLLIQQRDNMTLKKSETVSALSHSQTTSSFEPIKARNRLRLSQSIATCSRCSSILSLAANGSRYSLNIANGGFVAIRTKSHSIRSDEDKIDHPMIRSSSSRQALFTCKLCLADVNMDNMTKMQQCGCYFCTDCIKAYVEFEILEGAYEISCPDAQCPYQGVMDIERDIVKLVTNELVEKYERFRLNREIDLDKSRTWCPKAGCETVCVVDDPTMDKGVAGESSSLISVAVVSVRCPTCIEEFCSNCKKTWHPMITCEENSRRLAATGSDDTIGIFDSELIKCCPMCGVPIEKDEGCAQMMCKRCKHVFCWYCLASLDDDFLLRHYDKGPCKNKLGHSRASVVWHRAQVIGIFASFGILLLVASPLLLLAAPCIVCCKCRLCSSKLEDVDGDFEDPNAGAHNR